MKRIITSALIVALSVGAAKAQSTNATDSLAQKHFRHHHGNHMMALNQLNLTPEQKAQLKTIRQDFKQQMADLKKQDQITVAEMRSKRKELHKQFREKFESVLTPAQKDKLAQLRTEWKNKRQSTYAFNKGNHEFANRHGNREKVMKELGLSAEQQQQLKQMRMDMHNKIETIRKDSSLTDMQKKDQVKELRKQHMDQMKTVLTPDQLSKLQELRKERKQENSK